MSYMIIAKPTVQFLDAMTTWLAIGYICLKPHFVASWPRFLMATPCYVNSCGLMMPYCIITTLLTVMLITFASVAGAWCEVE